PRQRLRERTAVPARPPAAHQHPDEPGDLLMAKKAPTLGQIAVITAFTLSCVGILIYLWVSFGGSVPLRPNSYEVKVPFTEATQLADQTDVRISGVSVGKVKHIELAPDKAHA